MHLGFFEWESYKILSLLGRGRTGSVYKATLHGEIVAFKVCDLWQHPEYKEELLNELDVFHALRDLQGVCIPSLVDAGYTAEGLFAIATTIAGTPLGDVESLVEELITVRVESRYLRISDDKPNRAVD